jgi:hypothetical protein
MCRIRFLLMRANRDCSNQAAFGRDFAPRWVVTTVCQTGARSCYHSHWRGRAASLRSVKPPPAQHVASCCIVHSMLHHVRMILCACVDNQRYAGCVVLIVNTSTYYHSYNHCTKCSASGVKPQACRLVLYGQVRGWSALLSPGSTCSCRGWCGAARRAVSCKALGCFNRHLGETVQPSAGLGCLFWLCSGLDSLSWWC